MLLAAWKKDESMNPPLSSEQGSPADGPRGLSVGDIVTRLEDCPVRGVEDWSSCLFHLSHTPQTGYCVPVASLQPSWAHGRGERRSTLTTLACLRTKVATKNELKKPDRSINYSV